MWEGRASFPSLSFRNVVFSSKLGKIMCFLKGNGVGPTTTVMYNRGGPGCMCFLRGSRPGASFGCRHNRFTCFLRGSCAVLLVARHRLVAHLLDVAPYADETPKLTDGLNNTAAWGMASDVLHYMFDQAPPRGM